MMPYTAYIQTKIKMQQTCHSCLQKLKVKYWTDKITCYEHSVNHILKH
jgi:hypothetical protein